MGAFQFLVTVLLLGLVSVACTPATKEPPRPGRDGNAQVSPTQPPGAEKPDAGPGSGTNGGDDPAPGASSGDVDVVVVNAIGDENPAEVPRHSKFFVDLLAALAKKDLRVAVVASQSAAISGVSVGADALAAFPSGSARQINFELSPKDAFLGALVAGCSADASDLNASHAAGKIKVCGQLMDIPSHAWPWAVDDLKGQLSGFLRPGAKRVYVIVASNDVAIGTAKEFVDLAAAQNGRSAPTVHALVPTDLQGKCNDRNKRAAKIEEAARLSSGKVFSYCGDDWTPFIETIAAAL